MRYLILVISLFTITMVPSYADFHDEMMHFLPNINSFDENWELSQIQGFTELELNFSDATPNGVIQRLVFTEMGTDRTMSTTISIYDFSNKTTAYETYQKYVLNLTAKGYQSGQVAEELKNNCYASTINQTLHNEKTSIVCHNSKYIIISTSEQSNYVYHNNKKLTTTVAANGFAYTVNQNMKEIMPLIPEWIKNNAKWWSEGKVTDQTFINSLQFLIDNNIIIIPNLAKAEETQNESTLQNIPEWIKNNAKWWSENKIDDKTFIEGIQFLFKEGILK